MELIVGQFRYVLASFVWGAFLMFLYDFILVHRSRKKVGKIRMLIGDWIFWGISAVFVFQMIFELNNGILRSFFVVAFLLGMVAYRKLVKTFVQRAIKAIISFVFRPYVWICRKMRTLRKKSLKSR